jgi:hypothetical protein
MKILGFLLSLSAILLILHLVSQYRGDRRIIRMPSATYFPVTKKAHKTLATPEKRLQETKQTNSQDLKIDAAQVSPEGSDFESVSPDKPDSKTKKLQPDSTKTSINNQEVASSKIETPKTPAVKKDKQEIEVLNLSEIDFVAIDRLHDRLKAFADSSQKSGKFGWGLVGDYKDPDLAVRTLGGIPFAINTSGQRYYRIFISDRKVRPIVSAASYSVIGVEAHDSELERLFKEAVRKGQITDSIDKLSYHYLFTANTENYILGKVINAFEWFITKSDYSEEQADEFRKKARLRLAVWRAVREGGGEMGIAVPIYFNYNNQKLFLSQEYYQEDEEVIKLDLKINPNDY